MPNTIQVDRNTGNIYVLDSGRFCVDVFTSGGVLLRTIGSSSVLGYPIDMALNAEAGELFIADQTNNRIEVYSLAGQWLRRFGTAGFGPGQFTRIQGITLESDGQLAVLDSVYCRLQLLTPQGVPLATIGHLGTWSGAMRAPLGVAAVPGERLFVTSSGTNDIRVFSHWDWNPTGPQGTVVGFMIR